MPDRGPPRFAVIGNCQTMTFRDALLAYIPGCEVTLHRVTQIRHAPALDVAAGLAGFDRVFAQPIYDKALGPLCLPALKESHPTTVFIPGISFNGFQPDCVYVSDAAGNVPSPLSVYHSAIAVAAFTLGFTPARTARLFNALTYARLGYFDDHAKASGALVTHFARSGLDISERLATWQRHAAFMYTVNHPRALPVADMAWMLLNQAGYALPPSADIADVLGERLAGHPVFPVYPEIGKRIGVPGHLLFRDSIRADGPIDVMDLPLFLERSFAGYETMRDRVVAAAATAPRVQAAITLLSA